MSFFDLPLDSQISLLINLTPQDLSKYCQSSVEINAVCGSPEFMRGYIIRKFGIPPERLPGRTLLEKLRGHELMVRGHLTVLGSPRWEEDVIKLFDDALRLRSPEVFSRVLEAVRKSYNRCVARYKAETETDFFDSRIYLSDEQLKAVYRETFLRAIESKDDEALRLLLQYYSPSQDQVMRKYLNELTESGHPFANILSQYI